MAPPQPPIESAAEPARPASLGRGLHATASVLLVLVGVAVGVVAPFALSWLAWLSLGSMTTVVAFAFGLPYLVLLCLGCRLGAAGLQEPYGALLPALGWIAGSLAVTFYHPGGDIVVSGGAVNYLLLYGGMVAVALGVFTAPADGALPWSRRPHREDLLSQ